VVSEFDICPGLRCMSGFSFSGLKAKCLFNFVGVPEVPVPVTVWGRPAPFFDPLKKGGCGKVRDSKHVAGIEPARLVQRDKGGARFGVA